MAEAIFLLVPQGHLRNLKLHLTSVNGVETNNLSILLVLASLLGQNITLDTHPFFLTETGCCQMPTCGRTSSPHASPQTTLDPVMARAAEEPIRMFLDSVVPREHGRPQQRTYKHKDGQTPPTVSPCSHARVTSGPSILAWRAM